jgi:hypothetical protein
MQPIEAPIAFPHLDIDSGKDLSRNTRAALRYIAKLTNTNFRR